MKSELYLWVTIKTRVGVVHEQGTLEHLMIADAEALEAIAEDILRKEPTFAVRVETVTNETILMVNGTKHLSFIRNEMDTLTALRYLDRHANPSSESQEAHLWREAHTVMHSKTWTIHELDAMIEEMLEE